MRALVVVPTYNEAENIEVLLDGVLAADHRVDVLVVDDGSPDGTADLVAARAEREPRLQLLRRPGKSGLGAAYRAGFAWGTGRGYQVLVEMDADLSHPADRLPALLDGIADGRRAGADLVIGSRYVRGGATRNWPWHRQLISRLGNAYVGLALRLGVRDATAGFRAFRVTLLERIDVQALTSNGYCFQVETAYRSVRAGARVTEVPITFTEREHGTSKMSSAIVREALLRVTGWALSDLAGALARPLHGRRPGSRPVPLVARVLSLVLGLALVSGAIAWAGTGTQDGPTVTGTAPSAPVDSSPAVGADSSPRDGAAGSGGDETDPPARETEPSATTGDSVPAFGGRASAVDPADVPVEVSIPAIGVSSSLVDLGIARDGTLEVPVDYDQAGWLAEGPAPGERGPAVIAGHVDSKAGPAVFAELDRLEVGDTIDVTRADGSTLTFTVDGSQQVAKDAFPTADVYGPVPGAVLRLITCGGNFDRGTGHYVDNIVVYASLRA